MAASSGFGWAAIVGMEGPRACHLVRGQEKIKPTIPRPTIPPGQCPPGPEKSGSGAGLYRFLVLGVNCHRFGGPYMISLMKPISWIVLAILPFAASCLRAGVYGSLERPVTTTVPFSAFRLDLGELRGTEANDKTIPVEPGSLRSEYQALEGRLALLQTPTPVEKMELAVARMRMGQPDAAMALLEQVVEKEELPAGERFLGMLNLAACYAAQSARQGDGSFLLRAVTTQRRALENWPSSPEQAPKGWDFAKWRGLLAAEEAQYRLWRSRLREGPQQFSTLKLEDLGSGGVPGLEKPYKVGPASPAFWRETRDDLAVIQQLVLWNPADNRLYWLYGEWLNARGEVGPAKAVLEELVDARRLRGFPDLVAHWQLLREFVEAKKGAPPESGSQLNAADSKPAQENAAPQGLELPNWRTLVVGFALGAVFCLLAQMQWNRFFRRA